MIKQPKERDVRVLTSFKWNGIRTEVGKRLSLPTGFANEMRHAQKVEFVDADPTPMPVVVAEDPKRAKEKQNV